MANWDKFSSILLKRIDTVYSITFFTKNEIDLALDNFTGFNKASNVRINTNTQNMVPCSKKYVRWWNPDLFAKNGKLIDMPCEFIKY